MIEFLYKYRVMDKYSKEMIRNRKIYFANPKQFNDPFDCQFNVILGGTDKDKKAYFRSVASRFSPAGTTRKERDVMVARHMRNARKNPRELARGLRDYLYSQASKIGVYSLSEVPDDILMWSHYADSHKGFCLRFKNKDDCTFMHRAVPIEYSDKYPCISAIKDEDIDQIKKSLLTKSKRWGYEKEWRIIEHVKGPGVQQFPANVLSGVIFGCKMPEKDRKKISDWCGDQKISLFEARQSEERYTLDIIEADDKAG